MLNGIAFPLCLKSITEEKMSVLADNKKRNILEKLCNSTS